MIAEYIQYLEQVRGLSPRTCEEYRKNLGYFVSWAGNRQLRWSTIEQQHIEEYVIQLHTEGIEAATIKQRVSTLRSLFRWMQHRNMRKDNPARMVATPKLADRLPTGIDAELVGAWIDKPAMTLEEGAVKMLTAIILETGCRLNEALGIKRHDFADGGILIRGKGGKERLVFYGKRTMESIRKYCPQCEHLFEGWTDIEMRYAMYRTLGREVKGIHPHQLRHAFAMTLLSKGMPIDEVSQLLGHKYITTTQRYTRATMPTIQHHYNQIFN